MDEGREVLDESLSEGADGRVAVESGGEGPSGAELVVADEAIDLDEVGARAVGVHWGPRGFRGRLEEVVRVSVEVQLAEVIEADLRARESDQVVVVRVEEAEDAEADAVVGDGAELFLDGQDGIAWGGWGRGVDEEREEGSEPADGAREVDIWEEINAAVAFEVDEGRVGVGPMGESEGEGGEEDFVDAGVVDGGHLVEEGASEVGWEVDVELGG